MERSKIKRNLIIFSVVALACGWLGVALNQVVESPSPQESLGLLLWILAPLVTVLLLRAFGGDGWQDFGLRLNLPGNLKWYAVALFMYPFIVTLVILLAALSGMASLQGLLAKGLPALLATVGLGFVGALFKNVFEEFAWRGYLTPRFQALGLPNLQNHLLTGVIWGLWHVPYWLFFLAGTINQYTSLGLGVFIALALLGLLPTAIIYGELRLKTGSLWPAYLAHNMTNAISAQLVLEGYIQFTPGADLFFGPAEGLIALALLWLLAAWMMGWLGRRAA